MLTMPLSAFAHLGLRNVIAGPCPISVAYVFKRVRESLELCLRTDKNKTHTIAPTIRTRNSPTSTHININHL